MRNNNVARASTTTDDDDDVFEDFENINLKNDSKKRDNYKISEEEVKRQKMIDG